MTILKAQRHNASIALGDRSRVSANLFFKDFEGHEEHVLIQLSALKEALSKNRGIGILGVQLPGEATPRHVIINRFVKSKDGSRLTHLLLKEVADSDRIRAMVPVVPTGIMPLAKRHVSIIQRAKSVDLRGPVSALDHPVFVRVTDVEPGTIIRARDLELPEGAALCSDPDQEILYLQPVRPN